MPDTRARVYWDADVFLSYVNQITERMSILDTLLNQSSSSALPFKIVTSTYSMGEVAFGAQEQVQGVLSAQTEEDIDSLWDSATLTSAWLIGIVATICGVGLQLYFQGDAMANSEKVQTNGRKMRLVGEVWLGVAVLYLAVFIWFLVTGR